MNLCVFPNFYSTQKDVCRIVSSAAKEQHWKHLGLLSILHWLKFKTQVFWGCLILLSPQKMPKPLISFTFYVACINLWKRIGPLHWHRRHYVICVNFSNYLLYILAFSRMNLILTFILRYLQCQQINIRYRPVPAELYFHPPSSRSITGKPHKRKINR